MLRVTGTVFLGREELRGLCAAPELVSLELRGLRHLSADGLAFLLAEASTPGCGEALLSPAPLSRPAPRPVPCPVPRRARLSLAVAVGFCC